MPNPLDPIWNAHRITLDAYGVVRRSLALAPADRAAALHGGQFDAPATGAQVEALLDAAEDTLDEQTVMFLFATFEARLRDHVAAQGPLLGPAAAPGPQFGADLQKWFVQAGQPGLPRQRRPTVQPMGRGDARHSGKRHSRLPALARPRQADRTSAVGRPERGIHHVDRFPSILRPGMIRRHPAGSPVVPPPRLGYCAAMAKKGNPSPPPATAAGARPPAPPPAGRRPCSTPASSTAATTSNNLPSCPTPAST